MNINAVCVSYFHIHSQSWTQYDPNRRQHVRCSQSCMVEKRKYSRLFIILRRTTKSSRQPFTLLLESLPSSHSGDPLPFKKQTSPLKVHDAPARFPYTCTRQVCKICTLQTKLKRKKRRTLGARWFLITFWSTRRIVRRVYTFCTVWRYEKEVICKRWPRLFGIDKQRWKPPDRQRLDRQL